MIRTITEAEANNLVIPATDELILWNGPAISAKEGLVCILGPGRPGFVAVGSWDGNEASLLGVPMADLRLPLSHPEVQAHLVGWLGRGAWCPPCGGGGFEGLVETPTRYGCPTCGGSATKRGTGYLRPPADLYHLLKPQALGGLPDWIRLAMIWGSVVRVAAGMSALEEVLSPWWRDSDRDKCGRGYAGGCRPMSALAATWFGNLSAEERAAFDAEVIREPVALVDDTPTGRVIRFEVPDAP